MTLNKHIPPLLALSVAVFFLFLPSLHYGFHLEDYKYIRSYPLPEIALTFHSHWEPTGVETLGYRPLHSVHYAFFHWLLGVNPTANHLLQGILFLSGIWLVYILACRCARDNSSAFWIALTYSCLGSMAWHSSQLTNRQHLLQLNFALLSLLCFDSYISSRRKSAWAGGLICFLAALFIKEEVILFPLAVFAYGVIIRGVSPRAMLKSILPLFVLVAMFIGARFFMLRGFHQAEPFPPPFRLTIGNLIGEYARSLSGTLVQSWGNREPYNDFPAYYSGFVTWRDYSGLAALSGLILFGRLILCRHGTREQKKTVYFGLALLLTMSAITAAWYRTQRIYLGSIGTALIVGIMFSCSVNSRDKFTRMLSLGTTICFLIYLMVNIAGYYDLQWALRPHGFISCTWDRWVYEEYLPLMGKEQIELFQDKLRKTGRGDWAEQITRAEAAAKLPASKWTSPPGAGKLGGERDRKASPR